MPGPDYKRCTKCGKEKPLEEFYRAKLGKHGRAAECKACKQAKSKRHYQEARKERIEVIRRWQQANPERTAEHRRGQYERTPALIIARVLLGKAVRDGRITKPDGCEDCGQVTPSRRLHGHHQDYSKPLDVEWLCKDCHWDRHRC